MALLAGGCDACRRGRNGRSLPAPGAKVRSSPGTSYCTTVGATPFPASSSCSGAAGNISAGAAGRLGSLEAELAESRQAILRCHDEVTRRTAEALESVASLSAEAGEAERELALLAEAAGPAEAEKEKPPPDGPDEAPALPEPEKPEPTPDPE
mmetsp:Transcript_80620/g.216603  ORF Transcript_80620/g.216603 Transcript_80620/m.216603 type:complete len:153 (+) Transcript_80620:634-1092(+)